MMKPATSDSLAFPEYTAPNEPPIRTIPTIVVFQLAKIRSITSSLI